MKTALGGKFYIINNAHCNTSKLWGPIGKNCLKSFLFFFDLALKIKWLILFKVTCGRILSDPRLLNTYTEKKMQKKTYFSETNNLTDSNLGCYCDSLV